MTVKKYRLADSPLGRVLLDLYSINEGDLLTYKF